MSEVGRLFVLICARENGVNNNLKNNVVNQESFISLYFKGLFNWEKSNDTIYNIYW